MSIFLIGDSHVFRLRLTVPYDLPVNECYWAQEPYPDGYQKPTCEYEHLLRAGGVTQEIYFSGHKGKSAYSSSHFFNVTNPCIRKVINKDTIILPFFGYIDAKIQLVKYQNPEEAVKKYVDGFVEGFPDNRIRFIEPIPQFINNIGTGNSIYNFEDRYPMHKEFIYHLNKYCKELGLEDPISPAKILGVDKFDESYECHECDYCLSPEGLGVKFDHLKPEFNKTILDAIIAKMI